MPVGEICNREVVIARRGESVLEAARLMRQFHVGDLVIVEEKGGRRLPVGIVTDRDIVLQVIGIDGSDPAALAIDDIMTTDLATVREDQGLVETIDVMRRKGVRRVPVVDRDGGLVGILAVDDVIGLLADELAGLAGIVAREQEREKTARR
jgi:CBS domain-containing protein